MDKINARATILAHLKAAGLDGMEQITESCDVTYRATLHLGDSGARIDIGLPDGLSLDSEGVDLNDADTDEIEQAIHDAISNGEVEIEVKLHWAETSARVEITVTSHTGPIGNGDGIRYSVSTESEEDLHINDNGQHADVDFTKILDDMIADKSITGWEYPEGKTGKDQEHEDKASDALASLGSALGIYREYRVKLSSHIDGQAGGFWMTLNVGARSEEQAHALALASDDVKRAEAAEREAADAGDVDGEVGPYRVCADDTEDLGPDSTRGVGLHDCGANG